MDWFDDDRRAEVEEFFRGPWYASMSGDNGDYIVRLLRKEGAHGRKKTAYAGRSYNRAV